MRIESSNLPALAGTGRLVPIQVCNWLQDDSLHDPRISFVVVEVGVHNEVCDLMESMVREMYTQ